MKTLALALVVAAAGLVGCASPAREELPREFQGIALAPVSSPSVTVREPLLRQRAGRMELLGFVVKTYGAETTERTHLDVVFISQDGRELRAETARFSPSRLIRARNAPNRQANYLVPIDALPAGTTRIEVRAHDAEGHRT